MNVCSVTKHPLDQKAIRFVRLNQKVIDGVEETRAMSRKENGGVLGRPRFFSDLEECSQCRRFSEVDITERFLDQWLETGRTERQSLRGATRPIAPPDPPARARVR